MTTRVCVVDKDATNYFRGIVKIEERSPRVLELTEAIIRLNPAHYSAWCVLLLLWDGGDEIFIGMVQQAISVRNSTSHRCAPRRRTQAHGRDRREVSKDVPSLAPPPPLTHHHPQARARIGFHHALVDCGYEELPYVVVPPVAACVLQR